MTFRSSVRVVLAWVGFVCVCEVSSAATLVLGEFKGKEFCEAEFAALSGDARTKALRAVEAYVYARAGRWTDKDEYFTRAEWLLAQPGISEAGKTAALRTLLVRKENRRPFVLKTVGEGTDPTSSLLRSIYMANHENVFASKIEPWLADNPSVDDMHKVLTALQHRHYERYGEPVYIKMLDAKALTAEERAGFVRFLIDTDRNQIACKIWKEIPPEHPAFEILRKSLITMTQYNSLDRGGNSPQSDYDRHRTQSQRAEAADILYSTHPPSPEDGDVWLRFIQNYRGEMVVRGNSEQVHKAMDSLYDAILDPAYAAYNYQSGLYRILISDREYTSPTVFRNLKDKAIQAARAKPQDRTLRAAAVTVLAYSGDKTTAWSAGKTLLNDPKATDDDVNFVLMAFKNADSNKRYHQQMANMLHATRPRTPGPRSLETLLRIYCEGEQYQHALAVADRSIANPGNKETNALPAVRHMLELYGKEDLYVQWMERNRSKLGDSGTITGSETVSVALKEVKKGQTQQGLKTFAKAMTFQTIVWDGAIDSTNAEFHELATTPGFSAAVHASWEQRDSLAPKQQAKLNENVKLVVKDLMRTSRSKEQCVIAAQSAPTAGHLRSAYSWYCTTANSRLQSQVVDKSNAIYAVAIERFPESRSTWEQIRSRVSAFTKDYDETLFQAELAHMKKNLEHLHPDCIDELARGAKKAGKTAELVSFFDTVESRAPAYPAVRGGIFSWRVQDAHARKARAEAAALMQEKALGLLEEGALRGSALSNFLNSPPKGVDPLPALAAYSQKDLVKSDFEGALSVAEAAADKYPELALNIGKRAYEAAPPSARASHNRRYMIVISKLGQHEMVLKPLGPPQNTTSWKHNYQRYRMRALAGIGDLATFQKELGGMDGPSLDGQVAEAFAFESFVAADDIETAMSYYEKALTRTRERKGKQYINVVLAGLDVFCDKGDAAKAKQALYETINSPHVHKRAVTDIEKAYKVYRDTFPGDSVDFAAWEQYLKQSGTLGKNQKKVLDKLKTL